VTLPNYEGHITTLHNGDHTEDGSKKSCRKPILFNNVGQIAPVTTLTNKQIKDRRIKK